MMKSENIYIAVLVPCYNEEATVGIVVKSFQSALPAAVIHVFDNNSTDATAKVAEEAGAIVHKVLYPGKGNVVRRMFADIDADIYVMVDGDATYDAKSADIMVRKLIDENLDMVVGCRIEETSDNNNYRPGHRLGNKLLTGSVARIFGGDFTDMLSGYRVFSRRFAKSFSADSHRFETETELTVHTLELRLPYAEISTPYSERPEGSESKLSTYRDGLRILKMILRLYSSERPLQFWGVIGTFFMLIALALAAPVFLEYAQTGEVARFPTLIIASGFAVTGFLFGTIGSVSRSVTKGRKEAKHLAYLLYPSVHESIKKHEK